MNNDGEVLVKIAGYGVGSSEDTLVTLGLGSCVAVMLYDPVARVGGLAHILLPSPSLTRERDNPGRFPQTAIPLLVEQMVAAGAMSRRLHARLAGGASMFAGLLQGRTMPMGERNLAATRSVLRAERIPISGEAVGGDFGRSVRFMVGEGRIEIRAVGRDVTYL